MFYKLLKEQGEYIKNDTQECVNLVYGEEICTPIGKVTKDNLQGYLWFDKEEECLNYFNISKIEI
jgi:hypothetical protein